MLQLKVGKIQLALLALSMVVSGQQLTAQRPTEVKENLRQRFDPATGQLTFKKYGVQERPAREGFEQQLPLIFGLPAIDGFAKQRTSIDQMGMTHDRMLQTHQSIPIFDAMVIVHSENGSVSAVNGKTVKDIEPQSAAISVQTALNAALAHVGANQYQWEQPGANDFLRRLTGITSATWYPFGELNYVKATEGQHAGKYRLAWKFDIYAVDPLLRRDVFVDAELAEVVFQNDRICTGDALGIATTRFSGVQPITTDSTGPFFRLREAGRGQGVETFNMLNQTNYGMSVDFIDSNNVWDVFVPAFDNSATDAHWGAEMTYDYFNIFHGRNSYDDLGSKMISFVHYDNSYSNAFWNGVFMTYGDGGNNNNPFCGLDVCGHEVSHGVTEYTAGLIYSYESGALNESFSDIFGNSIEFWARPNNASWLIGDDIGAFRSMASPNIYLDPDTYLGTNWVTGGFDNGGVHTNSGVQNFWYYLLVQGGNGTNDNGDAYAVSGIGLTDAGAIAYRNLLAYLGPSDGYQDARYYSIQAAIDLFGECSPQMIATMNAWHAVGVGTPYTGNLEAGFYTADTASCNVPVNVQFQNQSFSALSYLWQFGDGGTSTDENPLHTYTTVGTYDVTLIAYGCNGAEDTIMEASRIIIDTNLPCNVNVPRGSGNIVVSGCEGTIYDSGGSNDYLPNTIGVVSIQPGNGTQLALTFSAFNYAAGDRITIFDGPTVSDPVLGVFAGTALPTGIVSSNGALTIRESTNGANEREGFVASWSCFTAQENEISSSNLSVSPNPSSAMINIRWDHQQLEDWKLKVYSAAGQQVYLATGNGASGINHSLNVERFSKGLYFVEVSAGSKRATQRIIVQ